jgi:Fe2+ transport system protein FeoA
LLQDLGALGLVPGAEVTVDGAAPYGDVITVRVGALTHVVGTAVTRAVIVETGEPGSPDAAPASDATQGATR